MELNKCRFNNNVWVVVLWESYGTDLESGASMGRYHFLNANCVHAVQDGLRDAGLSNGSKKVHTTTETLFRASFKCLFPNLSFCATIYETKAPVAIYAAIKNRILVEN